MTLKIVKMFREAKPYEKSAFFFSLIVGLCAFGLNIVYLFKYDGFEYAVLAILTILIVLTGATTAFTYLISQQVRTK